MKFESPPHHRSHVKVLPAVLLVCSAATLLMTLFYPILVWIAMISLAAALYLKEEYNCILNLENGVLFFSNKHITARIDRDSIERVYSRGGGILPRQLVIEGKVIVEMRNAKVLSRKLLLVPDEFTTPLMELEQAINSWRGAKES